MTQQVSSARSGPMPTAGRWGWYRDHEGNEFRRVSTLIKKVETDTRALDLWKQRQVAEGLAIRDDLVLSLKAMGRPDPINGWSAEAKKKINGLIEDAMAAAKQRDGARTGTATHDLTERLDRGEDVEAVVRGLPALAAQNLRAYAFLRRENGWKNVEIERTVVCDELEVAGSFDRVDLVPGLAAMLGPGTCQYDADPNHVHDRSDSYEELPVIVDVKTEAAPWLNGLHIGPQLAIYSRSKRMWQATGGMVPLLDKDGKQRTYPNSGDVIMVPAGEYVAAPCMRQDVAIVVHVHEGAATPLFLNLSEGWEAARAAAEQMDREGRSKRKLGSAGAWFAEVPGVKRPAVTQLLVEQAVAANYAGVRPENKIPSVVDTPAPAAAAGDRMVVGGVTHVAYARPDGWVDWRPATQAEAEAPQGAEPVPHLGGLDTVDRQAIETIWASQDTAALGKVWEIYTGTIGRTWGGRVAEAANSRRTMVECVQRELHAPGTVKCACGWNPIFPA